MRCRVLLRHRALRTTERSDFSWHRGTTTAGKLRIGVKKPIGCANCRQSRMIVGTHKRCPTEPGWSEFLPGCGAFSFVSINSKRSDGC